MIGSGVRYLHCNQLRDTGETAVWVTGSFRIGTDSGVRACAEITVIGTPGELKPDDERNWQEAQFHAQ